MTRSHPAPSEAARTRRTDRTSNARDVGLGLVATGARVGATMGRLAILPLRVAVHLPLAGPALRRAGEELASDGRVARAQGRRQLEDRATSVVRSLAEDGVVERLAAELLASAELEEAVAALLENDKTDRVVKEALATPGLERLAIAVVESRLTAEVTDRLLASPELQRSVGQMASSREVRAAVVRQSTSLATELVGGARRRAESADDKAERVARRLLRRPRAPSSYGQVPYAGVATRGVAFAIDVTLANLIVLVGAALLGLLGSFVGDLQPGWLLGALLGSGWGLVVLPYFLLFWTIAGQTPGMEVMRLRIRCPSGDPPGLGRSMLRLLGLVLAIVPLFAGFLPVLFTDRRRGLQDFFGGTVVVYDER